MCEIYLTLSCPKIWFASELSQSEAIPFEQRVALLRARVQVAKEAVSSMGGLASEVWWARGVKKCKEYYKE